MPETVAIDDRVPKEVWAVESEQRAVECVREAYHHRLALIPLGNGTKRHIGSPPAAYDVALWLRPLRGIVEYSPEDLTVTVRAGTTLAELQAVLAERGQFLPIDSPFPEQATIGGIVATAATGPCRCLYGLVREHLLGITVVQPDGTLTRFGGKVMKNVAGYDLTKLYVGSFGTLGAIVSATFKVRPLPEQQVLLPLWSENLKAVEDFLSQLVLSDIAPALAELLNESAVSLTPLEPLAPYALVLGFDGFAEEVQWWVTETKRRAAEAGLIVGKLVEGDENQKLRSILRDAHAGQDFPWVLKLVVPSSATCEGIAFAETLWHGAVAIHAHSLNGVVRVLAREVSEPEGLVGQLLQKAIAVGGQLMVEKAPSSVKPQLPVWGQPNNAFALMRRIKEALDPLNIFAPGRLV